MIEMEKKRRRGKGEGGNSPSLFLFPSSLNCFDLVHFSSIDLILFRSTSLLVEGDSQETLSAVIRVLAEGEDISDLSSLSPSNHSIPSSSLSDELVCMSEAWFISSIVSLSLLCLLLSSLIVVWGLHSMSSVPKDLPQ